MPWSHEEPQLEVEGYLETLEGHVGGYPCPKLLTFEPKVVEKVHLGAERSILRSERSPRVRRSFPWSSGVYPWTKEALPEVAETHPGALQAHLGALEADPRALENLPGSLWFILEMLRDNLET